MMIYSNPLRCLFVKQKKAVGEGKNIVPGSSYDVLKIVICLQLNFAQKLKIAIPKNANVSFWETTQPKVLKIGL